MKVLGVWLLFVACLFLPARCAEGSGAPIDVDKIKNPEVTGGKYLGPCYHTTEEIDWREAPRGGEPHNGDMYALDLNIQFAHTEADVRKLHEQIFGYAEQATGYYRGFTYLRKSTPGVCYVVVLMPRSVDSREMCTLGHEVLHCIAGEFHKGRKGAHD